jgi:hypothetical protein
VRLLRSLYIRLKGCITSSDFLQFHLRILHGIPCPNTSARDVRSSWYLSSYFLCSL